MNLDRKTLKRRARDCIRTAVPAAWLVTLVYILLTDGVSTVISLFLPNPLAQAAQLISQGADPIHVMEYILSGGRLSLFVFVTILITLYICVMQVGYLIYGLNLIRSRPAGYGDLTGGFSFAGKIIGLSLLISLYAALWCTAISMVIAMIFVFLLSGMAASFPMRVLLSLLFWAAMIVTIVAVLLRYALATPALADQPSLGVFGALRRSKELMRGRKGAYLVLILSFLGWLLLVALLTWLGGLPGSWLGRLLSTLLPLPLMLWLTPYMTCSQLLFYDWAGGFDPAAPSASADDGDAPPPPRWRDDPWNT